MVFIPMPLADSTTAGLTESRPVTVLRSTGMSAYRYSASIAGGLPMPTTGMNSANSASEGIVSTMPVTASTTAEARPALDEDPEEHRGHSGRRDHDQHDPGVCTIASMMKERLFTDVGEPCFEGVHEYLSTPVHSGGGHHTTFHFFGNHVRRRRRAAIPRSPSWRRHLDQHTGSGQWFRGRDTLRPVTSIADFTLDAFSIRDKRALVTGGNTGLGRAFTVALASAGADVMRAGLAEDDGDHRGPGRGSGRRMEFRQADLTAARCRRQPSARCVEAARLGRHPGQLAPASACPPTSPTSAGRSGTR